MGSHKLTQVSAGKFHSVFLTTSGRVYTAGGNHHGQLGDGTTTSRSDKVRVMKASSISHVFAGDNHTFFLI